MARFSRILVIRGGAIGDFLLTMPVLSALRDRFPESYMEVLGYPGIAQLSVAAGLANHVRALETPALAPFFVADATLNSGEAAYFASFDLIISYLYDPDATFRKNVSQCSTARFIQGSHRPDEKRNCHAATVFLQALEPLGLSGDANACRWSFPPLAEAWPEGIWLAIHPGSGSEKKNWPEANWFSWLQQMQRGTRWKFLLVGGEAEGARLDRLCQAVSPERCRIAFNWPLPRLGALLATCQGFIGHDSGISHLAAGVGLPCLLFWGPANPQVWRPLGERVRLLQPPLGLTNLTVSEALLETLRWPDAENPRES